MKKIVWTGVLALGMLLTACGEKTPSAPAGNSVQESKDPSGSSTEKKVSETRISNMADSSSLGEVDAALKKALKAESVDGFLKLVKEYNEAVENTGLTGSFEEKDSAVYDEAALEQLWTSKKGDFIGTNCRLNTFQLLKDDIEIKEGEADDSLLFLDEDAIRTGDLLSTSEAERFKQLFSKVKTEATKDVRVHAEKMKAHFSGITFDEEARMVSVVLHDNLDGDALFIGHVGVMTDTTDGVLFLEKLSFAEPYQAVKFGSKEDCYRYLYKKYEHFSDETTSKPFIMDNGDFVEPTIYGGM